MVVDTNMKRFGQLYLAAKQSTRAATKRLGEAPRMIVCSDEAVDGMKAYLGKEDQLTIDGVPVVRASATNEVAFVLPPHIGRPPAAMNPGVKA